MKERKESNKKTVMKITLCRYSYLTNKRLAFDKTRARIADFSKNVGDTILDIPLKDVTKTWKEGLLMQCLFFYKNIRRREKASLEFLIRVVG